MNEIPEKELTRIEALTGYVHVDGNCIGCGRPESFLSHDGTQHGRWNEKHADEYSRTLQALLAAYREMVAQRDEIFHEAVRHKQRAIEYKGEIEKLTATLASEVELSTRRAAQRETHTALAVDAQRALNKLNEKYDDLLSGLKLLIPAHEEWENDGEPFYLTVRLIDLQELVRSAENNDE